MKDLNQVRMKVRGGDVKKIKRKIKSWRRGCGRKLKEKKVEEGEVTMERGVRVWSRVRESAAAPCVSCAFQYPCSQTGFLFAGSQSYQQVYQRMNIR